jgi:sterol desaturase/sphingolipid hydroxylase (fatty acid hydroxylase superfamily)
MRVRWSGNFSLLLIIGLVVDGLQASALARQSSLPVRFGNCGSSICVLAAISDGDRSAGPRIQHHYSSRLLWRMHRLHHTDQDFDYSTAVRFHPGEALLEHGANLAVILLVGPPLLAVMLFALSYLLTTFWVHGNLRMPGNFDRLIRRVLVTPDMHRTHHSQVAAETNSNYGGLFSCWDRLFGTYVDAPKAGHEGMAIGLPEFLDQRHIRLGWMLANPWLDPQQTDEAARESGAVVR